MGRPSRRGDQPRWRRRATYTRPLGVRHLLAGYDLTRDRLYGHIKTHEGRVEFLAFCRYLRSLYPPEVASPSCSVPPPAADSASYLDRRASMASVDERRRGLVLSLVTFNEHVRARQELCARRGSLAGRVARMRIGVLGSGVVGQALAAGLTRHAHEIMIGTGSPDRAELRSAADANGYAVASFADAVSGADLVFLAVLGTAAVDVVRGLPDGALDGVVLVDATNPLDFSTGAPQLFVGFDDSLGERVQRAVPTARVVKAYNTVGNTLMVDPDLPGGPPTMLLAGEDPAAKQEVTELLASTGWDVVDVGGIAESRLLEPLCMLWVRIGMASGSWNHAFKVLR